MKSREEKRGGEERRGEKSAGWVGGRREPGGVSNRVLGAFFISQD